MKRITEPNPIAWTVAGIAFVSCVAVILSALAIVGFTDKAFVYSIRVIVKFAFMFFAMSYIAAPLYRVSSSRVTAFLMRHRATTGATFAVCQLMAAVCVGFIWFNYFYIIEAISSPVERVLGLIVLGWIFLMLLTSNKTVRQALSVHAWGKLQKYGMMVIWIAYLLDYGRRTIEWSPVFGIFVAILLAIFVLRLAALLGIGATTTQQRSVQG
ncbi:hypothetical protein QN399_15105 [Pseudomonas sp. 10C3]|uniref:hypothetical protein n=1 Tax=Pseudomonas sp. 10C3 TaxID=3118753 RepID=UPI002E800699|nr:hypothetical protein [Pseudomonas sp. 10C3]MEE3507575.1 hypothetical protein [Pseudomonas sp. 10C3]